MAIPLAHSEMDLGFMGRPCGNGNFSHPDSTRRNTSFGSPRCLRSGLCTGLSAAARRGERPERVEPPRSRFSVQGSGIGAKVSSEVLAEPLPGPPDRARVSAAWQRRSGGGPSPRKDAGWRRPQRRRFFGCDLQGRYRQGGLLGEASHRSARQVDPCDGLCP
jgi:hypothetical protein